MVDEDQAESGAAFAFGREEGIEDALPDGERHARAVVAHGDARFQRGAVHAHQDRGVWGVASGVDRVLQQVDDHLFEQGELAKPHTFMSPASSMRTPFECTPTDSAFGAVPQLQAFQLGRRAAHERGDGAHHVADAAQGDGHVVNGGDALVFGQAPGRLGLTQALDAGQRGGQGIFDLVTDGGQHRLEDGRRYVAALGIEDVVRPALQLILGAKATDAEQHVGRGHGAAQGERGAGGERGAFGFVRREQGQDLHDRFGAVDLTNQLARAGQGRLDQRKARQELQRFDARRGLDREHREAGRAERLERGREVAARASHDQHGRLVQVEETPLSLSSAVKSKRASRSASCGRDRGRVTSSGLFMSTLERVS